MLVLIPDADGDTARRVSSAILRELESGLAGFVFAIGRSRRVEDPRDLQRAGNEAMLSANVVEGEPEAELAFEATGTYQLLLPYMSDPAELKRFYNDTVRPLVVLRRAVRDRPARHARHVPGLRRERQRDGGAADHAPAHDPLPLRARARADRARRAVHRRSREAVVGSEGDASAGHRGSARPGDRAGRRGRPRPALSR